MAGKQKREFSSKISITGNPAGTGGGRRGGGAIFEYNGNILRDAE